MDLVIKVKRKAVKEKYTIGTMTINGDYFCDTLEDTVRVLPKTCPNTPKELDCRCKEKVYAETAILARTYKGVYNYSGKLKRKLILLLDTPHFRGIRIHKGKTADWSAGCILVGKNTVVGGLTQGDEYEAKLNALAEKADKIIVIVE